MRRRLRHRQMIILSVMALPMAAWAYACGDGAVEPQPPGPSGPTPATPTPTTVTVTPETVTLPALGATAQLSAAVLDQNGQVMAGTSVAWRSSDVSVAGVNSSSGLVTAVANGSVTVTATAGSASATAAVTVAQEADVVTVSPVADTLPVAGTVRLSADASDSNGHPVGGAEFAWASGDTLVALVDGEGLVTGVSAGEAEVTATSAGVTGRARLTVVFLGPPAVVAVSPSADTITPGETVRLAAEAFDANGFAVGDAEFAWSSSDVSVARVDASGRVTALAAGRAMVTAAVGEARGTSEITVVTAADRDRTALVALYEATDGPNWTNSENWLTDAPLGQWHGVTTDGSGRVSGIDLSGHWESGIGGYVRAGLSGPIPPQLGNLANLEVLNLSVNALAGPIPPQLGDLASLKYLRLVENRLKGPIPWELGNLANLEVLDLVSLG